MAHLSMLPKNPRRRRSGSGSRSHAAIQASITGARFTRRLGVSGSGEGGGVDGWRRRAGLGRRSRRMHDHVLRDWEFFGSGRIPVELKHRGCWGIIG
jgi:hypothetical protein